MQASDWLQFVSLMAVALALLLSVIQNREAARQTSAVRKSLEQSAYQAMNSTALNDRIDFLRDDPEMLEWHLSTRGYPVGSYHMNKRTLYLIVRLDGHEGNYLSYLDGLLPAEVWYAWHEVLKNDLEIADFQRIWPVARRFFARPFAELVECTLAGTAE